MAVASVKEATADASRVFAWGALSVRAQSETLSAAIVAVAAKGLADERVA
jgi:hypothetical protein